MHQPRAEKQRKAPSDSLTTSTEVSSGVEISDSNNATSSVSKIHRGPSACRGEVKQHIIAAARSEFVSQGYDHTTLRSIARAAGCDPALITYYFGTKQKLFRACMDLPLDPASEIIALLTPGPQGAATRLVDYILNLYEHTLTSDTLLALMRALITDTSTSQRFRTYIRSDVLEQISQFLAADPERARRLGEELEIVLSMLYGVVTMRYIISLEPLATMPRQRIHESLTPLLQQRIDHIFASLLPQ